LLQAERLLDALGESLVLRRQRR
jgi:hypothetical protein